MYNNTIVNCGFKTYKMILKIIYFGKTDFRTFLKTLFTGKYVGKDKLGNRYYKNKKTKDGLYIQIILRQQDYVRLVFMDASYD